MINMVDFEVYLQGGSPWGFRLQGGREFRMPIRIAKVEPGGKAHNGGIQVGDQVTEIDGVNTENMYHTEALTAVKRAQYSLSLLLTRPENNGETSNAIQSIGLTPEATNTKVSLVIGPKRSVSSDRINKSTEDIPNMDIPQGQTYMKKLIRSTTGDEEPVYERPDTSTLPRNLRRRAEDDNYTHPDFSSKSLPRKKENGYTHPDYSSKSLPRQRTKSTSDAPSKAPSWYKNMYKEMHTSMEKESHLSKLLASDAKRGAFRKYDGMTSPHTQRSNDCYSLNQSATFEDAPRRLQGGGRSIANHPNRKSLPNIHAASFNFMTDYSKANNTETCNKPDSSNILEKNKPRGPHSPKWETLIPAPDDPPDLLPNKIDVPKPINISVEYNNPPDFLELRKQEIKNRELEKERETIRQQREKERLAEEERLLEQKTRDFIKIEEEKRRLKLKEEELKLKEELIFKQEEEREEKHLLKLKEINLKRLEEEERQLKIKEEEIRRREEEEKRLLKLKEEELKRKEEMLLKQERELEERRLLRLQDEERKHREIEEKRLFKLKEVEDRKQKEIDAERLRRLREEEERRLEEERLKEEEERKQRALEEERLRKLKEEEELHRKLEEERLKQLKAEEELQRKREEERLKILKEEEERKQKELEEERLRILKEEEELQRKLEEERLRELKEAEERQLQLLKEAEEAERLELQRKAEELERKEKEELELIRLKEEELKRKEELLLKMEAEQLEKQRLLEESLQPAIPPFGRAKYSFHPQGPGELEFKKGEIITVLAAVDENWIEGEHKGNIGIFPVSYVELIDSLPGEAVPEVKPVAEVPLEAKPDVEALDTLDSKYIEPKGEPLVVETPDEPEVIVTTAAVPLVNGTADVDVPVVPEENIIVEKELDLENTPQEVVPSEEAAALPQIEEGTATARYTFRAETDSELSFKKGDAIVLLKRVDDNWYEGELNGQIGILPVNYVKVSKEPVVIEPEPIPEPIPEPEPVPVVEAAPKSLAEIIDEPMPASVLKPRKVEDRKPSAEMIIDEVLAAHETGKTAKENPALVNGYSDHSNGPVKNDLDDLIGQGDPFKVVFAYNATNEDEIQLQIGDVVHVLEKCDDGWFVGTSDRTGAFGTFPGNYVVPL